jgi:hypothetical protein
LQAVSRRPTASIDVRFHNWLEEMDAWANLNQNPNVTYMQMKDHPTQKAVMEEITSIQDEVQDLSKVEKMAATLFKYASYPPFLPADETNCHVQAKYGATSRSTSCCWLCTPSTVSLCVVMHQANTFFYKSKGSAQGRSSQISAGG